jgi:hypothetical protein
MIQVNLGFPTGPQFLLVFYNVYKIALAPELRYGKNISLGISQGILEV